MNSHFIAAEEGDRMWNLKWMQIGFNVFVSRQKQEATLSATPTWRTGLTCSLLQQIFCLHGKTSDTEFEPCGWMHSIVKMGLWQYETTISWLWANLRSIQAIQHCSKVIPVYVFKRGSQHAQKVGRWALDAVGTKHLPARHYASKMNKNGRLLQGPTINLTYSSAVVSFNKTKRRYTYTVEPHGCSNQIWNVHCRLPPRSLQRIGRGTETGSSVAGVSYNWYYHENTNILVMPIQLQSYNHSQELNTAGSWLLGKFQSNHQKRDGPIT